MLFSSSYYKKKGSTVKNVDMLNRYFELYNLFLLLSYTFTKTFYKNLLKNYSFIILK